MKILIYSILIPCLLALLPSCGTGVEEVKLSERDSLFQVIDSLEKRIQANKMANQLDPKLAKATLDAYQQFSSSHKKDSLSPWYLFRAADIASSALGMHEQGVGFYDQIIENHKTFPKYPESLFLAGFISQDKLHDGVRAKKYYDQLIAEFPNHEFVDDAKAMMSFFGKSDEDIVKEFEKQNEDKMKK